MSNIDGTLISLMPGFRCGVCVNHSVGPDTKAALHQAPANHTDRGFVSETYR